MPDLSPLSLVYFLGVKLCYYNILLYLRRLNCKTVILAVKEGEKIIRVII